MRRLLVGTAGHVDHGKTRLVEALTGIDCDRWAEEKARGITIDLGFAHFEEGDAQVGFVDVPGHERYLHNALAGLGGIDLVLLVVAADEGVRPQTREHLLVASLLGVETALVVLTKMDAAGADLADLVELEVGELLAATPFAGAAVMRVSAKTGEGIAALRAELTRRAATESRPGAALRPARLPIDRAFHLQGRGVVVTGTLVAGRIGRGDAVALLPGELLGRVRSIQVHGEDREEALAGERTALQVSGFELADLERGSTLAAPGSLAPSRDLLVRFRRLGGQTASETASETAPWSGWMPVRLHLQTRAVLGRLRPLEPASLAAGAEGLAELRLAEPVAAWRGDRFLVRRPSPEVILGGGEVLDPSWRRPRRAERTAVLAALGSGDAEAVLGWIGRAGALGLELVTIERRLGRPAATRAVVEALVDSGAVLRFGGAGARASTEPGVLVAAGVLRERAASAARWLAERAAADRFGEGVGKPEFLAHLLGGGGPSRAGAAEIGDLYLEAFSRQGLLRLDGDRVFPAGARPAATSEEDSGLAGAILDLVERGGLEPPGPGEIAAVLAAKPQIVEGLQRSLLRRGSLLRLSGGLIVSRRAANDLQARLRAAGWERFRVADFKDRFGLSRKWAIPWLEHLDGEGVTRRAGEERLVLPPRVESKKPDRP